MITLFTKPIRTAVRYLRTVASSPQTISLAYDGESLAMTVGDKSATAEVRLPVPGPMSSPFTASIPFEPFQKVVKATDKISVTACGDDVALSNLSKWWFRKVDEPARLNVNHQQRTASARFEGDACALIRTGLPLVAAAVGNGKDGRRYLCYVHLGEAEGAARFAATDGHRLHMLRVQPTELTGSLLVGPSAVKACAIGPAASVSFYAVAGDPGCAEVVIDLPDLGQVAITERLAALVSSYPEYWRVIPDGGFNNVTVEPAAAVRTIKSMMLPKGTKVTMGPWACEVNTVRLSGLRDGGSCWIDLPARAHADAGRDAVIGFNHGYLSAVLKSFEKLKCPAATMSFKDKFEPALIEGDCAFRAVVMPMR